MKNNSVYFSRTKVIVPAYNVSVSLRTCRFKSDYGLKSWLYRACAKGISLVHKKEVGTLVAHCLNSS